MTQMSLILSFLLGSAQLPTVPYGGTSSLKDTPEVLSGE